jgi:FlaG/FlaF family flagellin (archaellin)
VAVTVTVAGTVAVTVTGTVPCLNRWVRYSMIMETGKK